MRPYHVGGWLTGCALLFCAGMSANAQETDQERIACTADVFRLCEAYRLDADRVAACLRGSAPQLSRPCYQLFFPSRDVETRPDPREHFLPLGEDDD